MGISINHLTYNIVSKCFSMCVTSSPICLEEHDTCKTLQDDICMWFADRYDENTEVFYPLTISGIVNAQHDDPALHELFQCGSKDALTQYQFSKVEAQNVLTDKFF